MSEDGPTRLRDEPEFLALCGLRFDDEAATADVLNVDAGRAALESAVSSGATSLMGPPEWLATTASKVGAGLAVTATIASITLLSVGQSTPPPNVPPPVQSSPAVAEVAPSVADERPQLRVTDAPSATEETPEAAPASVSPDNTPARDVPSPEPKAPSSRRRDAAKKTGAATPPERAEPAVVSEEPTSTLPEQLALYGAGKEALAAGDHAGALKAFEAYRATFPAGTLRREVGLSMLEALVRSGKVARASRLAKRLLASGGLGARRVEVRRVLGEMQARLGRCDDAALTFATALQEGGSGLTLTAVEAAVVRCRSKQEVSP
jgi:TolA-binding protein